MRNRDKSILLLFIQQHNEEKRFEFKYCGTGKGKHYSYEQKEFAVNMIDEKGVRATAKILQLPRRTLQRWCRKFNVYVKRCPDWVYVWAECRKRRQEFWKNRGYF